MATGITATTNEIEIFRAQARSVDYAVRVNLEDINHEESLSQPQPAGNCLNWVLGHLLCIYQQILPLLGQDLVMERGTLNRYRRGSAPLANPHEVVSWNELKAAWQEVVKRVDAGLAGMSPESLDSPAPFSPSKKPDETVRSLLALVFFHQSYHAGQAGLLRRLVGKNGAIA